MRHLPLNPYASSMQAAGRDADLARVSDSFEHGDEFARLATMLSDQTLRRAAALAPVGWYLLTPPFDDLGRVNAKARFSAWDNWDTYDSPVKCELDKAKIIESAKVKVGRDSAGPLRTGDQNFLEAVLLGQCITADDPRLKSN